MSSPKILKLFLHSFLLSVLLAFKVLCQRTDTISFNSSITDPNFIVSSGNIFKFGFFTPENSTNRYLGIFYVVSEDTIVWVANRNNPLTDSSGTVIISRNGDLMLLDGRNDTLWSTNATTSPLNTIAQILDSGNLVLRDVSSGHVIWESFMHPTHVFLPTMKGMNDSGTSKKMILSSWRNNSDPAIGDFTLGMEFQTIQQIFTWKNGNPYWRSGPWNGKTLLGLMTDLNALSTNGVSIEKDSSGVSYVTVLPENNLLIRITIDPIGRNFKSYWDDQSKTWIGGGFQPDHECDVYGTCGPFGNCNRMASPICSCLRGFEPRDQEEWQRGNWSGGCVRRKQLQCGHEVNDTSNDGFLTLQFMKLPDFPQQFTPRQEDECTTRCLRNCSCIAYAYDPSVGCMFWSGSLIDVQQFPGVGLDLHIRLASSELDHKKGTKLVIVIPVIVAFICITVCIFIGWRWMIKPTGNGGNDKDTISGGQTLLSDSTATTMPDYTNTATFEELPLFTLEMLANATNQFCDGNLLGKGGFGHVYKGNLENGQKVAVKRLSTASKQGTKEFLNEVIVISKLQHKNLVRLVGYCVEREEKILVYEYMPNKSLDACLLDLNQSPQTILDWRKRFSIIEGVGRGLLYLHKDSRLKIIHRDLKPSNVLLDEDWSPKISDFGMARIFGGNQEHDNTAQVVGTYGYMAPEYAMEGRFSEKSDVYSFGVLMLEIISGKKSTDYYNHELSLGLLGLAWKLWSEESALSFVDQTLITTSDFGEEIMRCIHIALLCVQEYFKDRPDIQTVLSMLSKEIVYLPSPEKPDFAEKWNRFRDWSTLSSSQIEQPGKEVTVSVFDGR